MRAIALAIAATLLLCAAPAGAGDGRIEINQDKALAGGINDSLVLDPPGFPVIITRPGSYVLTGDLGVVDPNQSVLDIRADDVLIDLNGFAIEGPQVCDPGNCSSSASGNGIASFNVSPIPENTTVRNGSVTGFSGCVVLAAARMLVEGLSVSHCLLTSIQVGDDSLVLETRVSNVRFDGIKMGANTGFRDNVVVNADLSLSTTSFAYTGGRAIGGNICDDGSCNPNPARKRYYLTQTSHAGSAAVTACVSGFHMASLAEIHQTAGLSYETALGVTRADSGSGPPAVFGWIRTGTISASAGVPGAANCSAWSVSGTEGTKVSPYPIADWNNPGEIKSPWDTVTALCSVPAPVWCVED